MCGNVLYIKALLVIEFRPSSSVGFFYRLRTEWNQMRAAIKIEKYSPSGIITVVLQVIYNSHYVDGAGNVYLLVLSRAERQTLRKTPLS